MIFWWRFFNTHSCGFTGFQDTRKFRLEIISLATGLPLLTFLACLARHGGSHWCLQFLLAFLMVSLNSLSSGSMKWIPRNLHALSSFGFAIAHLCFSLSWAFLADPLQSSGHKWSGLDVACRFVSVHLDHIYPSGGFSLHRVNWAKPVQQNQTNRLIHRYSNYHRCGFLA